MLSSFFTSDLFILLILVIFLASITAKVIYDKLNKPGCSSCKLMDFDREMEKIRTEIKSAKNDKEGK